jgi:hypothetical protein
LGEQLDEDERIARAACWDEQSDVWTASPPRASYERYTVVDYCDDGVVVVTPENADADGVGQHVAEWDPARVLREIEADRELLDEYRRLLDAYAAHQREAARLAEAGDDADPIQLAALRREADYLPAMLHVLERWAKRKAAVYAARPGFREEWRPSE